LMNQILWAGDCAKLVSVVSALFVPLIGIITIYIAWQQHKTNKNQFRLALFDRRYAILDAARELIGRVLREGRVDSDDLTAFLWKTKESDFLFGSDIDQYLHELYEKAADVYVFHEAFDEDKKKKKIDALRLFSGESERAKQAFAKYMAFREETASVPPILRSLARQAVICMLLGPFAVVGYYLAVQIYNAPRPAVHEAIKSCPNYLPGTESEVSTLPCLTNVHEGDVANVPPSSEWVAGLPNFTLGNDLYIRGYDGSWLELPNGENTPIDRIMRVINKTPLSAYVHPFDALPVGLVWGWPIGLGAWVLYCAVRFAIRG
jgi:hypothetical protein